tara:strand:+ start:277 stop:600 length:324 start_codon:yes stop_codon:yes gene_type:complete
VTAIRLEADQSGNGETAWDLSLNQYGFDIRRLGFDRPEGVNAGLDPDDVVVPFLENLEALPKIFHIWLISRDFQIFSLELSVGDDRLRFACWTFLLRICHGLPSSAR